MAAVPDYEVRRMYSWWWDSHICPKNSKWLQENLADMDSKIEGMIRIIEEDADSFAQRAELFYRRRPELMKILEQFYRAYRALAERYDHAAGTLHLAQRKMAQAFPNQFYFDFTDELPSGSLAEDTVKSSSDSSHETFNPDGFVFEEVMNTNATNFDENRLSSTGEVADKENLVLAKEIQELKSQIMLEIERANNAENEIQSLKETFTAVNSQKEDALSLHNESVARVSCLEKDLCEKQNNLDKLNNEVFTVVRQLNSTERQKLQLEKARQSLESELKILKQRTIEQQEEIGKKTEGMVKLNSCLEEAQKQRRKAETAFQAIQKQRDECEGQMRILTLELQGASEKLNAVEQMNANLKEELNQIKEENGRLQEEKFLSVLKIINLQDEIILLTNLTGKLEDEVRNKEEQNKVLQHELSHLKEDRNSIEQKYCTLTEEICTVNLNIESLQAMMKDLLGGNFELKEIFKSHENEKCTHSENLLNIQTMSKDKEAVVNSLSVANNELEKLRQKVQMLEKSCCQLHGKVCIHEAEKLALVSQVESTHNNVEELSMKNTYLENSLSDMTAELDVLRNKLKVLQESHDSFHYQNSILISEKNALISQINNVTQRSKNLEKVHSELEDKHLHLQKEKDTVFHQVSEVQELLRQEKEDHCVLMQSSKNKLNRFEERICQLQETVQKREVELELLQHRIMNAQIEIFVLQRCLHDIKEDNLTLSAHLHGHQETQRSMQQECLVQKTEILSLTEDNKKLREWIHQLAQILKIDLEFLTSSTAEDELVMQLILREIKNLQHIIPVVQDEKQQLLLEKSVIFTVLEQFGVNNADLRSERDAVKIVSKSSSEELALTQCRNNEMYEINEKLKKELQDCREKEEQLKSEVDILFGQLSKMQDAHLTLQVKASKLHKENHYMSRKLHEMNVVKCKLENENKTIVGEIMALDCLSVLCRSVCAERGHELQLISEERDYLADIKTKLESEIQSVNEKLVTLEAENKHMKESVLNLDECRRNLLHAQDDINIAKSVCEQLNLEVLAGKNNLMNEKDMDFLHANSNMQKIQDMNSDLSRLPKLKLCKNEADVGRGVKDKKFSTLTDDYAWNENEILCFNQASASFGGRHSRNQRFIEDQMTRETVWMSLHKKGSNEVKSLDAETTSLFNDIQLVAMDAALFKDKVLELIKACQSLESSMAQRKVLDDDIMLRNSTIAQLKDKVDTLEGENRALRMDMNAHLRLLGCLCDDVAVLEEHTFSLARRRSSANNSEIEVKPFLHIKENVDANEGPYAVATEYGLSKLQHVRAKVKLLQKVVMDTESPLTLQRLDSNASLEAAWKEIEGLKSKGTPGIEIAKAHEERSKDIQLDIVLNPLQSKSRKRNDSAGKSTNQKLELWGKAEVHGKQKQKATMLTNEYDMEEEYLLKDVKKGKCPISELVAEELSFDSMASSKTVNSYQECRSMRNRLASDAQRLLILQSKIQELQKNSEASKKFEYPPRVELDTARLQLKDAETAITKLISVNNKLLKKVEDSPASDDYSEKEIADNRSRNQKLVFDRAQKLSEKIAKFELELQKIQHTLLKANEEHPDKRSKIFERGILLRDYIYGRRDSRRQKKSSGGCGCMRPRTKGD